MSGTKEFDTSTQKSINKIDSIKPLPHNMFNAIVNNKPEPVKTKTSPNNPKTPDTMVPPSEPKTRPKAANNLLAKSLDFGKTLVNSLAYSAYESPMLGLSQIVKTATNVNIEKYLPQVKAVDPGKFGTSNWYASQIGSGLGIALDFMLTDKLMGSKIGNLANTDLASCATSKIIGQSAFSGAIYEGVFSPSNINANHENLLADRLKQAFSGALTFGAMAGVSNGLNDLTSNLADKNILAKAVNNNLVNGIVSGSIGGIVNVNTDSLLNQNRLASFKNDIQTAYAYSVAGIPLGLAHVFAKPDNSITSKASLNLNNIADTKITSTTSEPEELADNPRIKSLSELTQGFDQARSIEKVVTDSNGKIVAKMPFEIPAIPKLPDITEYTKPELLDRIKTADYKKAKSFTLDNGLNIFINDRGVINAWFKDGTQLKLDIFDKTHDFKLRLHDGTEVDKSKLYSSDEFYTYNLPNGKTVEFKPGINLEYSDPKDRSSRLIIYNNGDLHLDYYQKGKYLGTYKETKTNQGLKIEASHGQTHFIEHPNGQTETVLPDGTEIVSFLGNTITTYPDGTEITKLSDGSIKTRNLDRELHDSVAKIVAKFNSDDFSQQQYDLVLNRFNETEKPIAKAILDMSLPNMSIKNFMDSVKLNFQFNEGDKASRLLVKNASSSGNAIAYLYRKSLDLDAAILPIDDVDPKDNLKAIYFDNLENLADYELDRLNHYNANTHPDRFKVFDAHNFDKGINFIDLARDNVYPKLKELVKLGRKEQLTLPDGPFLTPAEIADKVLNENNDIIAKRNYLKLIRPVVQDSNILLEPTVSTDSVNDFLSNLEFKTFNDKLVASSFLANDAEFYTVRAMLDRAKTLYAAIGYNIEPKEPRSLANLTHKTSFDFLHPQDDFPKLKNLKFAVGLDGTHGAGSSAFVNYIFKVANHLDDTQFLSRSNLQDHLYYGENLPVRSIVLLDDTAYSGSQIQESIANYFENHKAKLVIGLYGSYRDFEKNMRQSSDTNPNEEPELVVLESHLPIENESLDKLNNNIKSLIKTDSKNFNEVISQIKRSNSMRHLIDESSAFEDINSFQIWPYMTPDTSLNLVRHFGRTVLGFSN